MSPSSLPRLSIYFDPHDLWIGLFWRPTMPAQSRAVYICLIPTVVIRLRWEVTRESE